jgi:hypothetical protein
MKYAKIPVAIGVVAVLIVGGVLLFQQGSSGAGCVGEGACMLYFYAEW